MKAFAMACLTLSLSAFAFLSQARASDGRAEIVIYPSGPGGFYSTDIRQEGNKILGNSMSGNGLVNVQITENKFEGPSGEGLTNLTCDEKGCSGFINSQSSDLHGDVNALQGDIGGLLVNLKRTATTITVDGGVNGMSITFTQTSPGNYEGNGWSPRGGTFTATLKTSGTLMGLNSAALETIFLLAPAAGF
jgi:hypothetical protein